MQATVWNAILDPGLLKPTGKATKTTENR